MAATQPVLCTAVARRIRTTDGDWLRLSTTAKDLLPSSLGNGKLEGASKSQVPRRGACRAFNIYGEHAKGVPYGPILNSYRPQILSDAEVVVELVMMDMGGGVKHAFRIIVRVSS